MRKNALGRDEKVTRWLAVVSLVLAMANSGWSVWASHRLEFLARAEKRTALVTVLVHQYLILTQAERRLDYVTDEITGRSLIRMQCADQHAAERLVATTARDSEQLFAQGMRIQKMISGLVAAPLGSLSAKDLETLESQALDLEPGEGSLIESMGIDEDEHRARELLSHPLSSTEIDCAVVKLHHGGTR
jgi:hypothetical protein